MHKALAFLFSSMYLSCPRCGMGVLFYPSGWQSGHFQWFFLTYFSIFKKFIVWGFGNSFCLIDWFYLYIPTNVYTPSSFQYFLLSFPSPRESSQWSSCTIMNSTCRWCPCIGKGKRHWLTPQVLVSWWPEGVSSPETRILLVESSFHCLSSIPKKHPLTVCLLEIFLKPHLLSLDSDQIRSSPSASVWCGKITVGIDKRWRKMIKVHNWIFSDAQQSLWLLLHRSECGSLALCISNPASNPSHTNVFCSWCENS